MSENASTAEGAQELPADAAPVLRLAQRDAAIALAGLSLFAAADGWAVATELAFATGLSVLDGALVGVVLGTLGHEWGHFVAARHAGGVAPTRPLRSLFPMFDLDLERSDPHAFRAMSVGGNVAHWAVVVLLALLVGFGTPGRVALVAGAFGFAVSASVTEIPIIRRAYAGASPKESFRGLTRETLRRDRWIGAAAGLLVFLVLAL